MLDKNGDVRGHPIITAPGSLDAREDEGLIEEIENLVAEMVMQSGKKPKKGQVEEKIRQMVRKIIRQEIGKNPVLEVHLHQC